MINNRPPLSQTDKLCLVGLAGVLIATALVYELTDGAAMRSAKENPSQELVVSAVSEMMIQCVTPEQEENEDHDPETLMALARTVWGKARGCSATEQAAVVWCVLNRVDSPDFPDDLLEVVQQPNQFSGYDPENPVWPEHLALVEDVLDRWELEKTAVGDVGRVLPKEYIFFEGDGKENHFRMSYKGGDTWDWSLDSPYEEGRLDDSVV